MNCRQRHSPPAQAPSLLRVSFCRGHEPETREHKKTKNIFRRKIPGTILIPTFLHLGCSLLFLRHAPAPSAEHLLGCTPQGSPEVGNPDPNC